MRTNFLQDPEQKAWGFSCIFYYSYAKIEESIRRFLVQLIIILLIAVSILTLLSGIAIFSGARKGEKFQAFLFYFSMTFSKNILLVEVEEPW